MSTQEVIDTAVREYVSAMDEVTNKGDTTMTKTIKTELTRDEVKTLLEVYNSIDTLVDDTMEMMDVRLSQLSDARDKAYELKRMFDFRPTVDDQGNPNHWKPCVLPDDPTAWYYDHGENV